MKKIQGLPRKILFYGEIKMQENLQSLYDDDFFKAQAADSYKSAQAVLNEVDALLHPQSVIDVGCGVGTW